MIELSVREQSTIDALRFRGLTVIGKSRDDNGTLRLELEDKYHQKSEYLIGGDE
jgi:hypothetical protein